MISLFGVYRETILGEAVKRLLETRYTRWRLRDAVRRQQGQLNTIQHVQSIWVAFEPGEEMLFVDSKVSWSHNPACTVDFSCVWTRRSDAVRRQQGQRSAEATIQHVQSISVGFEPGEEMMFVDSKSPCNVCTQARPKMLIKFSKTVV